MLSRAIVYFLMAAILMAMPQLMEGMILQATQPESTSQMLLMAQQSVSNMKVVFNIISYLGGFVFGIKGAIEFKKYAETGEYVSFEKEEIKQDNFVAPASLEKSSTLVNDKVIDELINKVNNKASNILDDTSLDSESKYIAEKSISDYMPKVINTYKSISPDFINFSLKGGASAHQMTVQQLEIIYEGLCNIELSLLEKNHDKLKISDKFLKEVFKKEDYFSELEM